MLPEALVSMAMLAERISGQFAESTLQLRHQLVIKAGAACSPLHDNAVGKDNV